MPKIPSPALVAPAVLGGYAVGRATGNRRLAGVALAAGVGAALPRWAQGSPVLAAALTAGTVGLVGVSHPLSKRLGPWPAVLTTTAAAAVLAGIGDALAARSGAAGS
ncbi:hypothetical protein [Kineococcus rhizosphaerae]|uniref:Uncharacterized protein n=1 Tax=Kineococcus rhizosphaerae TaxID=559628 RepID=A0A2T0R5Z5_9ACTN|nr:hypothetical protein [Kineococcus rhizosphaerae]PRY16583.1 hypothetical protein CLV37_10312 [Kineococcus rhizosphaerae]